MLSANNETLATATLLSYTHGTPIVQSSSLDPLGDIDIFRVDLSIGDKLTVDLKTVSINSSLAGYLRIFDSTGVELAFNDGFGATDAMASIVASATGAYFVGVSDDGDFFYDPNTAGSGFGDVTTGAFDLQVQVDAPLPTGNDTLAKATPVKYIRDLSTAASGLLADPQDVNLFALNNLLPGDTVDLGLAFNAAGSSPGGYLRLFDAAGKQLQANGNSADGGPALSYFVTEAGKYFVGVSSGGNTAYDPNAAQHAPPNALGSYQLDVKVRSAPAVLQEQEPNDTLLTADVIDVGTSVGGSIGSFNDTDWYSLTINADGQLTVRVTADSGSLLNPLVTLYSSDFKQLYSSAGSAGGGAPEILQHFPAGTYFLQIASVGGKSMGAYHVTTSSIAASAPFAPVATGPVPGYVAYGDFNGDGKMDLVTADRFGDDVSVLLGLGDGTFRPAVSYAVHSGPAGLVVGDFNGDHILDIAVACRNSSEVVVLPGMGDGTFDTLNPLVLTVGAEPLGLASGDFNGDGKLDLATSNASSDDVTVLLNQGGGAFAAGATYVVGTRPESLVAADFNGDGFTDLAVANRGSNNLTILLSSASGAFTTGATLAVGDQPSSIDAGDVNGDGRADLVVANAAGDDVSLLLGLTAGGFAAEQRIDVRLLPPILAAGDFRSVIRLADANHDGKLDLLVANSADANVAVALGVGNGTFARRQLVTVANHPLDFDAADLNGDGRLDFFTADGFDSTATIRLGLADGTFQVAPQTMTGIQPQAIATGDFNSDGHLDLVTANAGNLSVLLGLGNGAYQEQFSVGDGTATAVVIGDFNGDGRPDMAATYLGSNDVAVYLGLGDGTFRLPVRYAVGNFPVSLVAADFNGDGVLDLATADFFSGSVTIWTGKADGTFTSPVTVAVGSGPRALASGDFNGDGRADLVVANTNDNSVSVLINNGQGVLVRQSVDVVVGIAPNGIVVGDFNGDGKVDFATANFGSNDVSVCLGLGGGSFAPQTLLAAGAGPKSIVAADLFGNGRLDLAVSNADSNNVLRYRNLGAAGFAPPLGDVVGNSPGALVTGDFNGDGRPDLATANGVDNTVSSLLNLGLGNFATGSQFVSGGTSTSPTLADYSGDGVIDSLVLNGAGQLLLRLGRAGEPGVFDAPQVLNAALPAGAFTTIRIAGFTMIAVTDRFADAISVYMISATGSAFRTQHFAAQVSHPVKIVAGDLNADGAPDLLVAGIGSQSLVVWRMIANGTFLPQAPIAFSGDPTDLELADVNGDGRNDIVALDQIGGTISVFSSATASGPYTETRYLAGNSLTGYSLNAAGDPRLLTRDSSSALAFGDFNRDGRIDVAIANRGNNSVDILFGLADGGLANPVSILVGSGPTVVRTGDFNGDGRLDLAALDAASQSVVVLRGDGLGNFTASATYDAGNAPNGLSLMDLNGDGRLDLVVGNPYGDALTLSGLGDGTFAPFTRIGRRVEIAVGDITGTGHDSWLVSNQTADHLVLQNSSLPVAFQQDRAAGVVNPGAVKMVDINGDGLLDLIVANSGGNNVLVYLGQGNGQFANAQSFYAGTNPVGLTIGDVNGDGKPDVVVTNQGSNDVSVLLGDSASVLRPGVRLNVGAGPTQTVVGDFNGDGKTDLAVASATSNQVWVLNGVGNGFFNDTAPTIFNTGSSPQSLIVGTFDGKLDLVTLNFNSNSLSFYSGFDPNHRVDIAAGGSNPITAVSADFNHDGLLDLIVGNNGDGAISVFLGGNQGLVLSETMFEAGLEHPVALALADLGDGGDLRLLCTEEGDELVRVFSRETQNPDGPPSSAEAALAVDASGESSGGSLLSLTSALTSLLTLAVLESGQAASQFDTTSLGGAAADRFDFSKLAEQFSAWLQTAEQYTDQWLAKLSPLTGTQIKTSEVLVVAGQLAANLFLPNLPGDALYQVAASYGLPPSEAPRELPGAAVDRAIVDMDLPAPTPPRFIEDTGARPHQASFTPQLLPEPSAAAMPRPMSAADKLPDVAPLLNADETQREWIRWAAIGATSAAALAGAGYGSYRLVRRRTLTALLSGESHAKLD